MKSREGLDLNEIEQQQRIADYILKRTLSFATVTYSEEAKHKAFRDRSAYIENIYSSNTGKKRLYNVLVQYNKQLDNLWFEFINLLAALIKQCKDLKHLIALPDDFLSAIILLISETRKEDPDINKLGPLPNNCFLDLAKAVESKLQTFVAGNDKPPTFTYEVSQLLQQHAYHETHLDSYNRCLDLAGKIDIIFVKRVRLRDAREIIQLWLSRPVLIPIVCDLVQTLDKEVNTRAKLFCLRKNYGILFVKSIVDFLDHELQYGIHALNKQTLKMRHQSYTTISLLPPAETRQSIEFKILAKAPKGELLNKVKALSAHDLSGIDYSRELLMHLIKSHEKLLSVATQFLQSLRNKPKSEDKKTVKEQETVSPDNHRMRIFDLSDEVSDSSDHLLVGDNVRMPRLELSDDGSDSSEDEQTPSLILGGHRV